MITAITNGRVIARDCICNNINLYIKDGKIFKITEQTLPCDKKIDAGGAYVSPGFIDMHTHGAGGFDFLDKSEEAYIVSSRVHAEHGATGIVPTITSVDIDGVKTAIKLFKSAREKQTNGAELLGLHAEGPYFAEIQKGAQESRFIHPFDPDEYNEIINLGGDCILRWSAAPELSGMEQFAKKATENDILLCIGHSDADYDCAVSAYEKGFSHVTHLYSCTSSVHRKKCIQVCRYCRGGLSY